MNRYIIRQNASFDINKLLKVAFQENVASFVSFWSSGSPSDVIFRCDVSGVDPLYGFSRTCDFTRTSRIFHNEAKLKFGYCNLMNAN